MHDFRGARYVMALRQESTVRNRATPAQKDIARAVEVEDGSRVGLSVER